MPSPRRESPNRHIRAITDKMTALGMRDVGYEYVIVGAGWQADTRAANGEMQADGTKFPSGMKALADYVHSKGFKFGLQHAPGRQNCPGWPMPGTDTAPGATYAEKAHFDANTFASWGVDFIRLDGCGYQDMRPAGMTAKAWAQHVYGAWRQALDATGREIVYWGNGEQFTTPEMWAPLGLNMWRIKGDLKPCWELVLKAIDTNAPLASLASPGHWNDPDFLVFGTPRASGPSTPCFAGGSPTRRGVPSSACGRSWRPRWSPAPTCGWIGIHDQDPDQPGRHRRRPGHPRQAGPAHPHQRRPGGVGQAAGRR